MKYLCWFINKCLANCIDQKESLHLPFGLEEQGKYTKYKTNIKLCTTNPSWIKGKQLSYSQYQQSSTKLVIHQHKHHLCSDHSNYKAPVLHKKKKKKEFNFKEQSNKFMVVILKWDSYIQDYQAKRIPPRLK